MDKNNFDTNFKFIPINIHGYYNQCKYYIEDYDKEVHSDYIKHCKDYVKFYEANRGNIFYDCNDGIFKLKGSIK